MRRVVELIAQKRRGEPLSEDDIRALLAAYTCGDVPDYQMAALAMASYHSALAEGPGPSLVEFALSAMTILYGGLLGVFSIAVLAPTLGNQRSAVAGLATGAVAGLCLFLHPVVLGETWLAWTWWIPLSATAAAAVTCCGRAPARMG